MRHVPQCRFEVLGPLSVGGIQPERLSRPTRRRLLSVLLLDHDHCISTDTLVDRLWRGRPPATAKGALHTHLSALRAKLPAGVIVTQYGGYRLTLGDHALDSTEFAALVARAREETRAGHRQDALATAERALALWRGTPHHELADDPFAQPEIGRLTELRIQAIQLRAESLMTLGRTNEAIPDLEWAVRAHPLREGLASLLARARQETGSCADALRSLRATERALAELGLEPSPALRELEHQILTHGQGASGYRRSA